MPNNNQLPTCRHCGQTLTKRSKESTKRYMERAYCSRDHANARREETAKDRMKATAAANRIRFIARKLDTITTMLSANESPDQIAAALNSNPAALARWLYRHQPDLAPIFDRRTNMPIRENKRVNDFELPNLPQAACKFANPDLFTYGAAGPTTVQMDQVKLICGGCPEAVPCLQFAMERGEHGVWAGTTAEQRQQLKRRSRRAAA